MYNILGQERKKVSGLVIDVVDDPEDIDYTPTIFMLLILDSERQEDCIGHDEGIDESRIKFNPETDNAFGEAMGEIDGISSNKSRSFFQGYQVRC